MILDKPRDFFGRNLSRGFIEEATRNKWWTNWYHPFDIADIDSLRTLVKEVDGVVYRELNEKFIALLEDGNIPYLHLKSADSGGNPDLPHVDDTTIGNIAAKEMERLDVVHRGYIGLKGINWSETRGIGYLKGHNTVSYLEVTEAEANVSSGIYKIVDWLNKAPKPAGIFTANDHLAVATLIACQIANLKVPDEVAVIGVDNNVNRCDSISPPLSSIDLHSEILGKNLAYTFAQQLGLIERNQTYKVPPPRPPSLVVRESSHHLNSNLVYYRKSVEWIYRNALIGPSVQQLADANNISRRALERAFKHNSSPAPAHVIREERIRQIADLLRRDSVSLQHIVHQAQFPDIPSLSNFVKRMTGKTPGEIREER